MPRKPKTRNLFRSIQNNHDERDDLMQQLEAAFAADDFTPSERNHPFYEPLRVANQQKSRRRKKEQPAIMPTTVDTVDKDSTTENTQEVKEHSHV